MEQVDFSVFQQLDIRLGTIVSARNFEGAIKPAIQLWIDFGEELGIKKSSAQLTKRYVPEELVGKQVLAVVNFKPKQIAHFVSECLVLGVTGNEGDVVLLTVDKPSPNGLPVS